MSVLLSYVLSILVIIYAICVVFSEKLSSIPFANKALEYIQDNQLFAYGTGLSLAAVSFFWLMWLIFSVQSREMVIGTKRGLVILTAAMVVSFGIFLPRVFEAAKPYLEQYIAK